jgi:uncharacterized membrane protein
VTDLAARGSRPHAFERPRARHAARARRARATFSMLLVVADVAMAGLVLLAVRGDLRMVAGLAFCLVVPGWAIVGLLRLDNPPLEAGLTMAAGLSALVIVAQLAISLGAWHVEALQVLVCALCLPSLCYQALRRPRARAAP